MQLLAMGTSYSIAIPQAPAAPLGDSHLSSLSRLLLQLEPSRSDVGFVTSRPPRCPPKVAIDVSRPRQQINVAAAIISAIKQTRCRAQPSRWLCASIHLASSHRRCLTSRSGPMPGHPVTRSCAGIEEAPGPRTTAVRRFLHWLWGSHSLTRWLLRPRTVASIPHAQTLNQCRNIIQGQLDSGETEIDTGLQVAEV